MNSHQEPEVITTPLHRPFREVPSDLQARFEALPAIPISVALVPQDWVLVPEMVKQAMDARVNLAKLVLAVGGQDRDEVARHLAHMEQLMVAVAATLNHFTIALMSAAVETYEACVREEEQAAD